MEHDKIKFIKKSFVFLVIIILLILFANLLYFRFILINSTLERTDKQFHDYKLNIKILFLGDSHTKNDINPLIINNSFNFASLDENYIQTYFKMKTILNDEKSSPEIIILPIDFHSFSSAQKEWSNNEWYWKRYIDLLDLTSFDKILSSTEREINSFFPIIGNGGNILDYITNPTPSKLIKGYQIVNGNFSNSKDKLKVADIKVKRHLKDYNLLDEGTFLYFQKILDMAQEKNIKVILIKFPVTEEYYNLTNIYIPDKKKFYKKIEDLTDIYNNIFIFDYQKIYFNNNSLFHDPDHLNSYGAEIFSEQIRKDLNSKLLTTNT